jgi:hypothetical protein
MVVAMVGGGIGSPIVGIFVAWLTGITSYRSRIGVEWGVIGAVSALLLVGPLQLSLMALIVFGVTYAVAAVSSYRVVVMLFEDVRQTGHISFGTLAVYSVATLLISGVICSVLTGLASMLD